MAFQYSLFNQSVRETVAHIQQIQFNIELESVKGTRGPLPAGRQLVDPFLDRGSPPPVGQLVVRL